MLRRLIHTSRDIVVIGGGPAGLSVLTAIRNIPQLSHLQVSVVEGQPISKRLTDWPSTVTEFENRVISLTPSSVNFLDKIGAWKNVVHDRVLPYDEMRVWDGESDASIDFDGFSQSNDGVIASMIEISNVQQALFNVEGNKDFVIESKVSNITRNKNGWPVVELENGDVVETRLLIGADGQQSPVRKYANIESLGWDYNRFGVVATLHLEYDNMRNVAYQRFLRSGPLAILPLPGDKATMVWSTLPERANFLKQLEPKALAAMVNAGLRLQMVDIDYLHTLDPKNTEEIVNEVEWRLDQLHLTDEQEQNLPVLIDDVVKSTVAGFPLRMRHAESYIGDRVALVGDAAHATHPLTGQGLNMGQRDIQCLVQALEQATERGLDIGSSMALEPYPRQAYLQNHLLLGVNDKFHKLYSTDFWPIVALRSAGLNLVDSLPFVKNMFMAQAGK